MANNSFTALVLGANGLIGSEVTTKLLTENQYSYIYVVTRRPVSFENEKIIPVLADFDTFSVKLKDIKADHLYCCIGTTQKKTPDKHIYYQTDHDYPLGVAELLIKNGCSRISIISSLGANPDSRNFYLKLKGNVEKSFKQLNINCLNILEPSLLIGKRPEKRFLEDLFSKLYRFINPLLIGKLENFRSINAGTLASAMVNITLKNTSGIHIYKTKEIKNNA